MATKDKRSFFERLTGSVKVDDEADSFTPATAEPAPAPRRVQAKSASKSAAPAKASSRQSAPETESESEWLDESAEEGQLTVDVYQTANDIVIKTIVGGVRPDDLDISITRDMVAIRGRREEAKETSDDDYFHKELAWGAFSRTIMLPEEVDPEGAEATQTHGLLTIRLPKLDKRRQTKLRVKAVS